MLGIFYLVYNWHKEYISPALGFLVFKNNNTDKPSNIEQNLLKIIIRSLQN